MKKAVVYGAGYYGKWIIDNFDGKKPEYREYDIVFAVDSDPEKIGG